MSVGVRPVERRESEETVRLKAMRVATEAGIADITAGRFRTLDTADGLRNHLFAMSAEALCDPSSKDDAER